MASQALKHWQVRSNDNGPGWALQKFSFLLMMYQRWHASGVVLSSSRQTFPRTRMGAAYGRKRCAWMLFGRIPRIIFRTRFRIAAAAPRGTTNPRSSRHTIQNMMLNTSSTSTVLCSRRFVVTSRLPRVSVGDELQTRKPCNCCVALHSSSSP